MRVIRIGVTALVLLAGSARTVGAQTPPPSAAEVLSGFGAGGAVGGPVMTATEWVQLTILKPRDFSSARVDSILDGLVEIAVGDDQGTGSAVRAAVWLVMAGDESDGEAISGILPRLEEVYDRASDSQVKTVLIQGIPRQAEALGQGIAFLERVASARDPEYRDSNESPAYAAVQALTHLGAQGIAALRRLHDSGQVTNPAAKARLTFLAKRGFSGRG